jgi:Tfp pilus assembly protein PilF
MLREINELAGRMAWRYSDAVDRVALGRAALLLGADPRQVLELFFDRVKKDRPKLRDVYLASGDLALSKHDYRVAADSFREGLKHYPDDPDFHFGLARAFAPSDARLTSESLTATLKFNPSHVAALLFQADHLVDSERYDAAAEQLEKVLAVNPSNPEAWSYRAVLAALRGDAARRPRFVEEQSGSGPPHRPETVSKVPV